MRMPDAPSCASVSRAPSPPINPRMSHVLALDLFRKFAREAFGDSRAVSALCRREKDDDIGKCAFEPRDLCMRHRIQRADLQKNTRVFSALG